MMDPHAVCKVPAVGAPLTTFYLGFWPESSSKAEAHYMLITSAL